MKEILTGIYGLGRLTILIVCVDQEYALHVLVTTKNIQKCPVCYYDRMPSLNPQQQLAVSTLAGPILVVAGAGAGKTRVITHRILNLIKSGVAPFNILAITFTNKAAKEMRERVEELLRNDKELNLPITENWRQNKPFVSTFHALGVHIIRAHANEFGLSKHFKIFDRTDSKRAIKEAMLESSVDPKKFDPGFVLNKISLTKGSGITRLQFLDTNRKSHDNFIDEIVASVWDKYETILTREKALDFDDLLLKTAQLLEKRDEVRQHYGNIWKYIHVDEYQDTNVVQYKIVKLLVDGQCLASDGVVGNKTVRANRNICVVGDADQNIYSWRGATIENILNFERDYPEAKVITLEKNYRSTKIILAAANDVIRKNVMRKEKNLYTDNVEGEQISLLVSYTENDEARTVVENIRQLIEGGVSAREIAVLYRANFQSRALEEFFIKKNVSYQLVGTRFFERKEVKDVLAYIHAALDRERWGDISRAAMTPPRGIGKSTLLKMASGGRATLPASIDKKVKEFWKLLDDIKEELITKKPSESLRFIVEESGLKKTLGKGDSEDEDRLLNLRELASVATQYDDLGPNEGIDKFLENAVLATDQDDLQVDKDAVKLMTVHASKGLEFEHVFIVGMEQDLFPFKHIDEGKASRADNEEERRLFYVAITRAKRKVYLSYAIIRNIYGAQRVSAPSEFIDDIAKELIEQQVTEKPSGAKAIFIDF